MYLTYAEYQNMGGTLTQTAFNNVLIDAEALIDWYTFNRLVTVTPVDLKVKQCAMKLIDLVVARQNNLVSSVNATSPITMEQNDGVTVQYATFTASELLNTSDKEISKIVKHYLNTVKGKNNKPVLYRGLYEDE